jgi:hypothetical protein
MLFDARFNLILLSYFSDILKLLHSVFIFDLRVCQFFFLLPQKICKQKHFETSSKYVMLILYCSILFHCVGLTLRSTFCHLCATSVNVHLSPSLYCIALHVWPSQPRSGVQVVVMKESAALL